MAAAATRVSVIGGETTSAAPPTMSGKAKKNGLATPPVSATRSVATVIATDPSTTNFAGPSVSGGSRSWTTTTNRPENARRMRIAGSVSGHSPVAATMTVVVRRKTQATMRTTRSYVWAGTPSSVADSPTPPTTAASAARRSSVAVGPGFARERADPPEQRRQQDHRHHEQVRQDRHDDQEQDRFDRQGVPRSGTRGPTAGPPRRHLSRRVVDLPASREAFGAPGQRDQRVPYW